MTAGQGAHPLSDMRQPEAAAAWLRTTTAVRERAAELLARARRGDSEFFTIGDGSTLDDAAREVVQATQARYAWRPIPYHSRWRHFEAGGVDRSAELDRLLGDHATPRMRAQARIDLAVVSVLLDAGAGADWSYHESASDQRFSRSEGLAVASFHAFTAGLFSSDPDHPLQADAAGLRGLVADRLAQAFQVRADNPLVGLDGRVTLLRRLGEVLAEQPQVFGTEVQRPGGLFDMLIAPEGVEVPPTATVQVHDILTLLLESLSAIWPTGNYLHREPTALPGPGESGLALGDCWQHSGVGGDGHTKGWVPFHKLSQWLTYSLIEPFEWAGVKVEGLDALTGLPEYRNGGLLLDAGVIVPRDAALLARSWQVADEFIVEWRALTVALLDELAPLVRKHLGRDADAMPLACVLEGGTWAAGRATAERLRGGLPPLRIDSDGTVF